MPHHLPIPPPLTRLTLPPPSHNPFPIRVDYEEQHEHQTEYRESYEVAPTTHILTFIPRQLPKCHSGFLRIYLSPYSLDIWSMEVSPMPSLTESAFIPRDSSHFIMRSRVLLSVGRCFRMTSRASGRVILLPTKSSVAYRTHV